MPSLLIATTVSITIKAFLIPYARHFRINGWRVDAMARDAIETLSAPAYEGCFDAIYDATWSRNPLDINNMAGMPDIVRDIAGANDYDIVHVHTPVASFVTRFALRKMRLAGRPKVVYTAHGFHFFEGGSAARNFIFGNLEKAAGRWTDHLITINEEDRDAALAYGIVPPEKLSLMPGIGLDLTQYDRASVSGEAVKKMRAELGLGPDDALFSMIAEFNPGKRHLDAINALFLAQNKKIHLAFAGEGPTMDEAKETAEMLGLGTRVHFLGFRRDVNVLMRASVATVLPSEREGLARCAMESLSLGVPVIGSDARGVRDLVTPQNGIIFPVGDTAALAAALDEAAANPARFEAKADEAWDINHLLKLHDELYAKLTRRA